MSNIPIIDYFEEYCIIIDSEGNKRRPILTGSSKWLLENLEKDNIQRVWTRKYGWQYKTIK